ncbi:S1 family peptidase [Vreelandella boliviensis]|uniref:S1 family peptidase n=1 Tax=Vreelandella boliviensis TaxID=223527 RepID=UPI001B8B9412|nr:serine protease [Halomonas boliviensis]MBS3668060.1 trypsin-like peptidase domain-containing protein [Halomonas boliviensis]
MIEQLVYSTYRLEAYTADGRVSSGTGFCMLFENKATGDQSHVIVTNKHVIDGCEQLVMHTHMHNGDGNPIKNKKITVTISLQDGGVIRHPNPRIDLACFSLVHAGMKTEDDLMPFYVPLETALIPTEDQLAELSHMENVVMIGYPNGIWDEHNNLPIIRRGVTATHPGLRFNDESIFITDIATFPGSSGSPVLIVDQGSYVKRDGTTMLGYSRAHLLGVTYATYQRELTGEVKKIPIPTADRIISQTNVPIHLGLCVHSKEILELERELWKRAYVT